MEIPEPESIVDSDTTKTKSKEVNESVSPKAVPETKEKDPDDIFAQIACDDVTSVHKILRKNKNVVDSYDEHGMSPLQHAAYKGNKELCQILIDYGADVNGGRHNNGYSALHFAALSGNAYLCQLLLQNGANPGSTNSVKRTAAQMGAFVGNHHCVATINSFVDFKDVEHFTKQSALGNKPPLDPVVARALHQLIMQVNFHPVKVILTVKKSPILLSNILECSKVLEGIGGMSDREITGKGSGASEIISFKLHLLGFLLKHLFMETKGEVECFDPYIKSLVRPKSSEILLSENLELLLRQGVREFRFIETTIMQQLVTNLSHTKVCEEPGAWSIINTVVNGQKGFRDHDPCVTCGEERGAKKCSRCHYDAYCDQECQKLHWFVHKKYCKKKAEEYKKNQELESTSTS